MKKQFLVWLLLVSIGFNALHAFVLDTLDTHPCGAKEYLHEIDGHVIAFDGDICHIHAAFHTPFILPHSPLKMHACTMHEIPAGEIDTYTFYFPSTFFRPPASLLS